MTGDIFIDTNVLLYAIDDKDTKKRDKAREWLAACWQRRCGRLSTQVLGEFYVNVRKKFPSGVSAGDARVEIRRYPLWQPWVIDHPTIETAWAIEARYRYDYWDALMLAAAKHQGCRYLLSEDMQHDEVVEGVHIVNPFKQGIELLDAPA